MKLYTVTIHEANHLPPAFLFSSSFIDESIAKKLRFAQEVIQAQWLCNDQSIPCFIISQSKTGTTLFDNVYLINPQDWDNTIEQSEVVLLNDSMFHLCRKHDSPVLELEYFSAEHLKSLFEDHMFIVAGVY